MKHLLYLLVLVTGFIFATPHDDDFQLIIEPKWENLELNPQQAELFGGKWVLIGSITFKKKSKETISLNKICLSWQGEPIDELLGSLYRKNTDKDFLPLQEQLVCDGSWNKTKQTLQLTFDQKHTLSVVNIFYLVLTIPHQLEPVVKKGKFEIVQQSLPEPFRTPQTHKLSLSLDALGSTTASIED